MNLTRFLVFVSLCVAVGSTDAASLGEIVWLWPEGTHSCGIRRPYLRWYEVPDGIEKGKVCALIIPDWKNDLPEAQEQLRPWVDRFLLAGMHCAMLVCRAQGTNLDSARSARMADGQRAIRLLRLAAASRGYAPERIGAFGLSSGGGLAFALGTCAASNAYAPVDAIDEMSCHLNWTVPVSPEGVLTRDLTVDPALSFDVKTCPSCIFGGTSDSISPFTATRVYRSLRRKQVPAEIHLYSDCRMDGGMDSEAERAMEFLRQIGILGKLSPEVNHDHRFFFDSTIRTEKVPLWPRGAVPDYSPEQGDPYLVWFIPENPTTRAIQILAPGGAYISCNFNGECTPAAHFLNGKGITAAALMYRHPRPKGKPKYWSAWQDAQRAVRLVRREAPRRGLDPNRIGFMGFSAGGHLALLVGANSQTSTYAPVDETDRLSCAVQWVCPIYPGSVLTDNADDKVSKTGGNDDADVISDEFVFDSSTPPMCFVHGDADFIPAMNSVKVWERLQKMGICGDVHTLAGRGHCFQIKASPGTGSWTWMDRVLVFLDRKGLK